MTGRCVSDPVSWLRLERHHLGESIASERAAVADHLSGCPACAACLATIATGDARELPPLSPGSASKPRAPAHRWAAAAGLLAAAAVIVLVLVRPPRVRDARSERDEHGAKGGDGVVAFTLLSDEGERMVDSNGVFRDGARFKALVTCAPGTNTTVDLVIFDDEGASFPLEPTHALACGNDVPLPGAFRLTGNAHETVCVAWTDGAGVDRPRLAQSRGAARSSRLLCKDLLPASGTHGFE